MKQVSYNHFTSQPSTSKKTFDVSQSTLRRWANQGIIHCARYGRRGKRLYDVAQLCEHLGVDVNRIIRDKKSRCIIYARVSSSHQKEDLQRQIQDLQSVYPGHDVISDIGSGLNFKRKWVSVVARADIYGYSQTSCSHAQGSTVSVWYRTLQFHSSQDQYETGYPRFRW